MEFKDVEENLRHSFRALACDRPAGDVRDLGWSFWVCIDLLPSKLQRRAERLFERNGLRLTVQLPGMCAERLLPPRRPLPQIEIRRVADEPTRLAFCDIG